MGPRLDRRGNYYDLESLFDAIKLQWGHAWIGVGMTWREMFS